MLNINRVTKKLKSAIFRANQLSFRLSNKLQLALSSRKRSRVESQIKKRIEFLSDAIEIVEESNADSVIIHPFLKQNIHLIDENLPMIFEAWGKEVFSLVEPELKRSIALTTVNFGVNMWEFPLGNRSMNIEVSIVAYELSLEILQYDLFPRDWAMVQYNLSAAFLERIEGERSENIEYAIHFLNHALKVYTLEELPEDWAMAQSTLGNLYSYRVLGSRLDSIESAIECYKKALRVYTHKYPKEFSATNNNMGAAYRNRIAGEKAENIEKAIEIYKKTLEICQLNSLEYQHGITLNNIAASYSDRVRGEKSKNIGIALKYFNSSLEFLDYNDFPEDWAMVQGNLANIYQSRDLGCQDENFKIALDFLNNASKVYRKNQFPLKWAQIQNLIGLIFYKNSKTQEKAFRAFRNALKAFSKESLPEDWAMCSNNLGNFFLYREKGFRTLNLLKAIKYYKSALEVFSINEFPLNYVSTKFNLGLAYQALQSFHDSFSTLSEVVDNVEYLRAQIFLGSGIEEDKRRLFEDWHILYQTIIEVCLELAENDESYHEVALEYIERSKSRNLVELLSQDKLYPRESYYIDDATYRDHCRRLDVIRKEFAANQNLSSKLVIHSEDRLDTLSGVNESRVPSNLLKKQEILLEEINDFDSQFVSTQIVQPIKFNEIKNLLWDSETAIIEWFFLENSFLIFVITKSNVDVFQSSAEECETLRTTFDKYLKSYTDCLTRGRWRDDLPSLLKEFEESLYFNRALELLGNYNRLILIPHRFLHTFPIHSLPLKKDLNKCIIDKFKKGIIYAPSCQILLLLKQEKDFELESFFGIQNPTEDLTYASLQVEQISKMFSNPKVLVGTEASISNLVESSDLDLDKSNCLHFACHADFREDFPLESYFKMTGNERLKLSSIFRMSLSSCRLVTLSACETGLTDHTSITDEYVGLPSGFLFSGSPAVVSTLWKVDELATAFLMIKFYANLSQIQTLNRGDISFALSQAQLWLRDLNQEEFRKEINKFSNDINKVIARLPTKGKKLIAQNQLEQALRRHPQPFVNPYYWAGFISTGF